MTLPDRSGTHAPGADRRQKLQRGLRSALTLLCSLGLPVLLYYVLRGFGVSVYTALLITAALSAVPSIYQLVRRRTVGTIALYFSAMSIAALAISMLPGSAEFLLARGAVLTGATAVLFAVSLRARRPVVFWLTRPILEGRWNWPAHWDGLYEESSRFRRMWQVATLMWAAGLMGDAVGRVVMAFTLPPDIVPALATVLYVVTLVVLNVATNVYYIASGVFNRGSRLYLRDLPAATPPRATPPPA